MSRAHIAACLVASIALAPAAACAQSTPQVVGLDGQPWSQIVAALAEDLDSQGSSVALCVRASGHARCAPCSGYSLQLDAASAAAFRLDACDEVTGVTTAHLVDRSALFDHSAAIPVPRTMSLGVAMVGRSSVVSGRPQVGGSAESCSVRVRPFVRDLEHGETVYLDPSEYDVRVASQMIRVDATDADGFVLWSTDRAQTEVSYDVVERATGSIVVVGHASLDCTSAIDVPAVAAAIVAPPPLAPPDRGRSLRTPMQSGGIHIRERDEQLDASRVVAISGLSLAVASALTLIADGIANVVETAPGCSGYSGSSGITVYGSAPSPSTTTRYGCHGALPSHVPAELTYVALGGLGVGALLGAIGLVLMQTLPAEHRPELALDLGPNGGSIGAMVRF